MLRLMLPGGPHTFKMSNVTFAGARMAGNEGMEIMRFS